MRAPSLVVAVSLAGILAACSNSNDSRFATDDLDRDLDLAMQGRRQPAPIASQLESGAKPQPKAHAATAPRHSYTADAVAVLRRPTEETAPVLMPTQVKADPAGEAVTTTAEPVPDPTPASATPEPEPQPAPARTGRGGGWYPAPTDMGVPGTGPTGVIIIRGGGSGDDDCDERGHGGIGVGRGGVLINPRLPGRIGGGIGGVIGGVLGGRLPGGILH